MSETRQVRRALERVATKIAARKPPRPVRYKTPEPNEINMLEVTFAQGALMTGERAQKPSWAAIRKMVGNMRHHASLGLQMPLRHQRGDWRSWPKNIGTNEEPLHA